MGAGSSKANDDSEGLEPFRIEVDPNLLRTLIELPDEADQVSDEVVHEEVFYGDQREAYESGYEDALKEQNASVNKHYAQSAEILSKVQLDAEKEALDKLSGKFEEMKEYQKELGERKLACEAERQAIMECYDKSEDKLKCSPAIAAFSGCAQSQINMYSK